MGKAKNFSEFTYGVGLEITAQSFKQVKDDLKLNLDNLSKMVKSYEKVLKIDPDADLSKLFAEMRKLQGIVDGINGSDNSFSGFVDKGTLGNIAALEERLRDIDSTSDNVKAQLTELKSIISTLMEPLKSAGSIKFPATFENLFGNFEDQTDKIKSVVNQITLLTRSLSELEKLNLNIGDIFSGQSVNNEDVDIENVKDLIQKFYDARNQLEHIENLDDSHVKNLISQINEIGVELASAVRGLKEHQLDDLKIDDSIVGDEINELISSIKAKKHVLATELADLEKLQSKFVKSKEARSPSKQTSLGLQSDLTAQVKVTPKANDAEWADTINDTIKNVEPLLKPVRLTPTFSKSKNISKEMEGNLSQINHAVDVELKVDHNIEKFNEQINNIDTSIKNAKKRLEQNGNFKIKFEYEEGGNFRDVAYKIINQLKQVEVHVDKQSTKTFLTELGNLRTAANKELKNIRATVKFNSFNSLMKSIDTLKAGIDSKLGKHDIVLGISNEPEVIAQATLIRDKLISLFGKVPINLGINTVTTDVNTNTPNNTVEQLSEAAQEAQQKLEQCRQTLESLQKLGFNSPHFLELGDITAQGKRAKDSTKKLEELLNKYKELKAKLPDDVAARWQELYPEANGDKTVAAKMAKQVKVELKKVEAELNTYVQKQIAYTQSRYDHNQKILQQEKEIVSVQKSSSDNAVKSVDAEKIKKAKNELVAINNIIQDLKTNGFKSSEFLNLGDIDADGNKIEASTKRLKRLLTEYNNLKKRTTKEKGEGSNQWLEKYPKAKGDMTKVQQLIEKDEKRIQKIESLLNQYAQKQIAFLSSRQSALQKALSTEEQITSENTKQAQVNKSDVGAVSTNQKLAISAEEASKKIKSLNGKLTQQKKMLKDLEENGINAASFVKLGEWDKEAGSFKKNKEEIQQLVNKYNELKSAREKAGGKKAVGEEASLRGKLAAILRQQKQHASEIVAQNQAELNTTKAIVEEHKKTNMSGKTVPTAKTSADIEVLAKNVEQLTDKLNKARSALSSLKSDGITAVGSTGLKDTKGVLKNAGITQGLKQTVELYNQLLARKKELGADSGTSQSVGKLNKQIEDLVSAKQLLEKKGFLGLTDTKIGDVKGRLGADPEALNNLISQYHQLLTAKKEFEKSGDTTSDNYKQISQALEGATQQLKILRQDQMSEIDTRIQTLQTEMTKRSEYARITQECKNIEDLLADVHKNQVDYATRKVELYSKQLNDAQKLLEVEQQRAQIETNKSENIEPKQTNKKIVSDKTDATTIVGDGRNPASVVKLDSATLNSLAKDNTLKSIDSKIGNILNKFGNGIKITGSNISIEASNVSVSGNTTKTTYGETTSTNTSTNPVNANVQIASGAKQATGEQKKLNAELDATNENLSNAVKIVNARTGEVKKEVETYKSSDRVFEQIETSGWVNHGKDEPPTWEHVSTVYKTNMEAYNKMYQDYIKSMAKQIELQKKIDSSDGSTAKMQAELEIQKGVTEQLELQLKHHAQLFTEQARQNALTEATKKAEQEVNKSVGSQKDKSINRQNNELLKIVDSAQSKFNEMQYSMQNAKIPMADAAIAKFKQYEQLLTNLKSKQQEIQNNPDLLKQTDYANQFSTLLQQMDEVESEFNELHQTSVKFAASMESIKPLDATFDPSNLEQMHDVMREFADQAGFGAAKLLEFNDAERSASFEITDARGHVQKLVVAYDEATNSLGRYTSKTKESLSETQKFINSLKHSFQNVAKYIASFGSIYELWAVIKQGITYVRDIDSALTELKKVTNETDASYASFLQDMAKTGKVVGATVKDLTTMASEWARLGYSMQEAGQLAQSTAVLLNVSEFEDATKASEALISTMQAFKYTADESGHVVDILNEIGNNYAVSSDGIAIALQDSASALMEGGNNLEQAVALVAAANRVVQDPNSVGSALRTISLRLRGTSVKVLEEIGEETDGVVESTSKLQEKIEALSGVNILTDSGEYKDTYTILKEIGQVWEDMSDIDQAALLELMAGKNRANTLSAILSNMKDLENAYNDALQAEGSALKENQAYLDSIQGRIDLFNNSVQTMWMNAINSDLVKDFVDFGTGLINLIDKLGLFESLIASIFTYFTTFSKHKIDFASILGIHDLDAGWFAKKAKTKKGSSVVDNILGDPSEIKKSVENFADTVRKNINDYVTIDTSQIDSQINSVQKKLDTMRQDLEYATTHKKELWQQYKDAGSTAPAKDRDNDIAKQRAEIKALEQDLIQLQQQKDSIIATTIDSTLNTKVQEYQSMLSVLDQIKDSKLYLGNEQDAAVKIDALSAAAKNGQADLINYVSSLDDADIALKAYAASVQDGNYSLAGFQQFITQHNAQLKTSSVAAKAAAAGHQLLNAALSMGIALIASFAIDMLVKGLDALIVTNDELIQQADELQNAYATQSKTIQDNISTLQGLEDEFNRLSSGVDDYGNNISLATEDYQKYQKIVENIIGISPSLIEGYDSEGNAIANKNGLLEESIRLMQEEQRLNAQKLTSDENLETIGESVQAKIEEYKKDNPLPYGDAKSNFMSEFAKAIDDDNNYDVFKALSPDGYAWADYSGGGADIVYAQNFASDFYEAIIADLRSEESKLKDYFTDEQRKNMLEYAHEYEQNVQVYDHEINSISKELISTLQNVPLSESEYYTLNDEMKGYITQYINGLDVTTENLVDKKRDIKDFVNFLANNQDAQLDLSKGFKLNLGQDEDGSILKFSEYQAKITEFINKIQSSDYTSEQQNTIFDLLGLNIETKEFDNEITKAVNHAKNLLQDEFDDNINNLSISDILITTKITEDPNSLTFAQLQQQIKEIKTSLGANVIPVETYSSLVTSIESYNDVLVQTSEIVSDNTEVTQEYKDSLIDLGLSEEDLADCFDENNGLIVKNADKLKDLIKKQKDEYKNNVKTAKSQAKLKYYKLAKDLVNTVKSTKNLTNTQRDHIKTILEEMDAVQDTISKYTMLESELLGVTNAYKKLADAQEIDSATDYGSKAEEMVNALANAFNTGELGTAAAEAAFEGLIPDWVVANAQSVDEAMESAYNYMRSGNLAGLFDIKYDDDGKLESVQMTLDKVKSFTGALIEADEVFHGTWDEFTLDPAIQNLDDFANALGVTKEVAFAYLTELERYDASNIFGDSATGLLDQLMGDNFDYAVQQASQKYAKAAADMAKEFDQVNEKVNMFNRKILYDNEGRMVTMASQTFKASDFGLDGDFAFNVTPILPDGTKLENVEDYIYNHLASGGKLEDMDIFLGSYDTLDEAIAKAERLSQLQGLYYENQLAIEELENKALDFASAWGKTSDQLTNAREEAESLGRELADAKNGVNESTGRTVEEIEADIKKNDQLISDLLSNLDKLKDEFGGEPTEMVVGVALDELQEDIDDFKKDLEKKPAELKAAITEIDSAGFENLGLTKNADGSWSGLAELDWYQKLDPASKEEVTNYLDMIESEHYLNLLMGDGVPTIEDHLQTISTVLQDIARMMNPTYTLHADTANATNNVITFKSWWNSLGDKVVTLYQRTIGSWFGGGNVNGTANVGGTAYAGGKWGAKQTETSLVGELGPEMVVRGNRWFTVGENGAEFTQVKKGDIIFNHKQTEELLENGHVTSRGKAYASGTAYAGIDTFTPYVPPDVSSGGNNDDDDSDDIADDIADDAEEVVDFIEMKLEEIEAIIEKTSTRITNFLDDTTDIKSKDELYDELVKAEKDKSEAYLKAAQKYNVEAAAALSGVPQQYQEMARNGAIEIKDFIGEDQVEIAEKIQEYRDWAAKADEAENGHLEAIAAISAHRVEQLEDIATDFENIVSISKSHSDLLQAEMDLIEESGNRLSESYYEELKMHTQKQLDDMQNERAALQKILDDSVAAGDVVIGSDDWYAMLETIYEVDQEIVDCKITLEEFQNAINDLYWDNFDKLIDEIDNVDSELSNLYDLIADTDNIVDDMGNWTDDGVAALGLLAQQMENAQFKSQQYGEAIAQLKKDYADGLYSTDEYNEKLAELTDGQYDAIKSYEDAKDAIVDLNKARIDAVKDGMQKEIDAYSELIEKKKESLNSDKDAYDFQKQVQESNKNIEDIERKIAALEGNTSSSAMAQKKRLEAELLKAREELNDLYYDHSIEKQQEALDKELESYTENKQKEMDALDEYLKNEEQVVADSFDLITKNTETVVNTLTRISEEYGVTISSTIATPWINGANAIGTYEEQLNTSVSATTANLETLKQHLEELQIQADKTAESVVAATHSTVVDTNDGHQTSIKGYAKGSKGVEYDQWAIIEELGDELQLVPNKSGRLDYIKKGTGILNNTLTERLIDLAMDPTNMLENSRPVIGTPGIATTNNTITIDASVGTLLNVEHLDGSNPAEVAKLVDNAWEKKMQTLNNSIKKFTR